MSTPVPAVAVDKTARTTVGGGFARVLAPASGAVADVVFVVARPLEAVTPAVGVALSTSHFAQQIVRRTHSGDTGAFVGLLVLEAGDSE